MRITMLLRRLWGFVVLAMVMAPAVGAAVPGTITYQGYLTTSTGTPVSGTVSAVFGLYSSPTGTAAPLWTETQSIATANGVYAVQLGSITGFNTVPGLFDNGALYLGIAVNGDPELLPRQQLTSVGYALRAEKADSVPDAALSANVALLNGTQTFAGANTLANAGNVFAGDGAGLTNLNADNLASGTLPASRLSGTYSGITGLGTIAGDVTAAGEFRYSTPKTRYYSVHASGFSVKSSSTTWASNWGGGNDRYLSGPSGTQDMVAPLPLPDGVTVKSLSCLVTDSSTTYGVTIGIIDAEANTWICGPVTSSSSSGKGTLSTTCSYPINAQSRYFAARYTNDTACGSSCSLYGCTVTYQEYSAQ